MVAVLGETTCFYAARKIHEKMLRDPHGSIILRQHQKHVTSYLPWAINCGFKAKFLMNVYFEKIWEEDLEKSRKELNIPPLPA